MQGTAAAYDLAQYGSAQNILMMDNNIVAAVASSDKVNQLVGRNVCFPVRVNARGASSMIEHFEQCDAILSCLPYFLNEKVAETALNCRCHYNDLGGNVEISKKILAMHERAQYEGVSLIPDCGLAPGAVNSIAALLIRNGMNQIYIYCGGLPQNKDLPLGYKKNFSIHGLLNEYQHNARRIRHGKLHEIPALSARESGTFRTELVEEFDYTHTSGGVGTAIDSFLGKVDAYEYVTLRHHKSDHFEFFRNLIALDLIDDRLIDKLDKKLTLPDEPDRVIFWINANEIKDKYYTDNRATVRLDVRQDENFSAMEKTTGFSAAIVTAMQTNDMIKSGAVPLELSVDPLYFTKQFQERFPELRIKSFKELK